MMLELGITWGQKEAKILFRPTNGFRAYFFQYELKNCFVSSVIRIDDLWSLDT